MPVDIKIPPAGESVTEATVSQIFKENGSYVKMDEELFELETEKVNQVVYAPAAGVITLNVKVDDTVTIDQVVGSIDTEAKAPEQTLEKTPEQASEPTPEQPTEQPIEKPDPAIADHVVSEPVTPADGSIRVTKDQAIENLKTPVSKAPPVKEATPAEGREERKRMSKLRKTIAKKLVEAKNTTAMLTTFNEVDMSQVMEVRKNEQEAFVKKHGVKLGFMSFFVKACTLALKKYPDINAYIDKEEIVYRNYYDIGVAVGSEKGLFVPVIRNCDQLSFAEIESTLKDMALRAREGKITVDEMQGGGFTISNGGVYGSLLSTPIVNYPQSGILGMHAIVKRPVAIDDQIEIRPMMYLALSYDHRIVDGKTSIEFLVHIKNMLEDPRRFLLDL